MITSYAAQVTVRKIIRVPNPGPLILVISLLLVTIATACNSTTTNPGWSRFGSPRLGHFSIEYPDNWKSERFANGYRGDKEIVALFYPPAPQLFPVVQIARQPTASPTLENAAAWGLDRFMGLNDEAADKFEVSALEEVAVDGAPALSRGFLMDTETALPLRRQDIYVVRDGDMLIITLISPQDEFNDNSQVLAHMIASFRTLHE